MARILFTVWPIPGHFYPQVAIAQALRDRGHECAFYTGTRVAAFLESEGFRRFPLCAVDEDGLYRLLFERPDPMDHSKPGRLLRVMQGLLLDTVQAQVTDLEPVLDAWEPDVIASDPTVWAPMLILHEKRGIPVTISSFSPACWVPGPDAPPFGLGLPRPATIATRLLARTAYLALDVLAARFRRRANALRVRHGLPPLDKTLLAHTGTMPLYLVPGAPELDYERRDLPPSVQYVGPLVRQQPADDQPPAFLAGLSRERPWVYVTEGTVHVTDPLVLRATAQGLGGLPLEVLVITGDDRDPAHLNLGPLAPNVHLERWVTYTHVLPNTRVMVTSGGPGSVSAALGAGIPVLVIPTEWDKPEIAQRVAATGAGLCLPVRRCTPEAVRRAVERLLVEESFRRNAERMAGVLRRYKGAPRAAELIEGLAVAAAPARIAV